MIYFLVLAVLVNLVLFYILFKQVRDGRMLIKLNNSLDDQLTSYKVSQSSLIEKMREMELLSEEQVEELSRVSLLVEERKFLVGAKIHLMISFLSCFIILAFFVKGLVKLPI